MDKKCMTEGKEYKKILTIVIPTYNMEKYLTECLDSVTNPIVGNTLEVIIVNDGSTDSSLAIAKQYENKRPDIIKIIDKQNGNYGSCVNAGLAQATGKYFRILDADDWFDTQALAEFLEKLETCETDLVLTLIAENIFQGEKMIEEKKYAFQSIQKDHIYQADQFLIHQNSFENEFRMHGMTYKTSILRACKLYMLEGVSYTDNIFLFQPFSYIKDFIVFDLYLYHYRMGREGQTMQHDIFIKRLTDIGKVVCYMFDIMDQTPNKEPLRTNQLTLIKGALCLFLHILRFQKTIHQKDFPYIKRIIKGINKYGYQEPVLQKWYFKLWQSTESSRLLQYALTLRSLFK